MKHSYNHSSNARYTMDNSIGLQTWNIVPLVVLHYKGLLVVACSQKGTFESTMWLERSMRYSRWSFLPSTFLDFEVTQ